MEKDRTFIVIDIETTGLNSNPDYGEVNHIIEVGAVKIEQGKITEKFSSFCACPISLPDEIVKLTGISNEDLANAPSVKQVLFELNNFCKKSEIVGHNVSFDLGFLNYYGAQQKILFKQAYADTLTMSRLLLKNKLVNYRLATVADYFKLKFNGHRALNDAMVTAKIFIKLINLQDKQEKKRNRWVEKLCKNCKNKCHLYEDNGKWVPEITPNVYRKTLCWLLDKKTITLAMMQRELKMEYPLAANIMDSLKLDGFISCTQNIMEKRVNQKKVKVMFK
ncbi:MAG: 3'-5' exonuclease [Clostridia bacterium]|nr:3'-5' exonuclease [Clostridia bacterium]